MEELFRAAREGAARRIGEGRAAALAGSRQRARDLLKKTRARAHSYLDRDGAQPVEESAHANGGLTLPDLHTLERLTSYVRHSVVRVCFYNLKLFCPSLVDEYDAEVREEVIKNIDQLAGARREIEQFFGQPLSDGRAIGQWFPEIRQEALEHLRGLEDLARPARDALDDEPVRAGFGQKAPQLIDAVMDAVQHVQEAIDARKMSIADVAEKATGLCRNVAHEAGITLEFESHPVPRVFGDQSALTNVFTELVANAAKYSQASVLHVTVGPADNGRYAEVLFKDNGKGMTADEAIACVERGVTTGGTGEGLAMVVQIVEEEHFGQFKMTGEPGRGCTASVRLPVKLSPRKERG